MAGPQPCTRNDNPRKRCRVWWLCASGRGRRRDSRARHRCWSTATADLALDDVTADVPLGAVGMQRDFRPLQDGEQFGLHWRAAATAGDRVWHKPGAASRRCDRSGRASRRGVGLSAPRNRSSDRHIEPPDEPADALLLCVAVQLGEGVEHLCTNRSAWIQHSACRPTSN